MLAPRARLPPRTRALADRRRIPELGVLDLGAQLGHPGHPAHAVVPTHDERGHDKRARRARAVGEGEGEGAHGD